MRRRLIRLRQLGALALVACSVAACASAATPADWQDWDLGAFRMRTPTGLHHVAGGTDSQAGAWTADGVRISYDYGLYSDPLNRRSAMLDYQSSAGKVDGLDARFVRFRVAESTGPVQTCSGVHVPLVGTSSMGKLSLTMLACAADADRLQPVPAMFESIRFQGPAARP